MSYIDIYKLLNITKNPIDEYIGLLIDENGTNALLSDAIYISTLRPRQDGLHFTDDTFKRILLNENVRISIKISLKFVPKGPINNIPALI